MIPGYGFVRFKPGQLDFEGVRKVRGVRGFMKIADRNGDLVPAGLSDEEVNKLKSADAEAFRKHQILMAKRAAEEAARLAGKPEVEFEEGKEVRIEGPLGETWIGKMLQQRGAKRVVILRDNAKIIVSANKIHKLETFCE
jgi:transcription antitermination factor NusG